MLRLYLLGSFRLERGSRTIRLATHKVESLLAYLALFPGQHPREKLAALLWGDSTDEQARHSLRTALAAIRKALGEEILFADRETVQLNPDMPMWVDARAIADFSPSTGSGYKFQIADLEKSEIINLKSAIDLYQGDLLPDFYDDWILRERERLRAIYVDALLRIAQDQRAKSEYAQAIETAQKVLAADRASEKAYQHLMFCFAAQGDRIAALKQYDDCKRILRDELNVEPSSETTALRDQIMQELTGAPSREAALTNLPNPLTSFVGREQEQRELKDLFEKTRLLTLTGVGGSGKTRLAIQIARDALPNFKHGVWWVELAALSDPALVPQGVARVLGVQESREHSLSEMLTLFIRDKPMLIALDNCEHLIAACAELAEKLLLACPNLKIIATSREGLNVIGETAWRVPSLAVPDIAHLPSVDGLTRFDAIQLFVQRASAVEPNWKLDGNARAIAQICTRLDGIPLAIELAAARVKTLSPQQIAERLDDRFRLLTGGSRTALPRQRTLQAATDWSYKLLSESERALLRRLSVFAGGWTLEAAEFVCADDVGVGLAPTPAGQPRGLPLQQNDILDLISQLVDKSLIVTENKGTETRYRLLETIRQYAQEKLTDAGEDEAIRNRHLDFFLKFAQEAEKKLHGPEELGTLGRLDLELDNLRAALQWSLGEGRVEKGLKLVGALLWFWEMRGYLREGRDQADKLLLQPSAVAKNLIRANGLLVAGVLTTGWNLTEVSASRQYLEELCLIAREYGEPGKRFLALGLGYLSGETFGDNPDLAESMHDEGIAIARSLGDQWLVARMLRLNAWTLRGRRKYSASRKSSEESLMICESIGDRRGAAESSLSLGRALFAEHDYEAARQQFEQSLLHSREVRDRLNLAFALNLLGEIERVDNNYEMAKKYYLESLEIRREIGSRALAVLGNLGFVYLHENEIHTARSLFLESLTQTLEIKSQSLTYGTLLGFAAVMTVEKNARRAVPLYAVFQTFIKSHDVRTLNPIDELEYERYLALAREQLDEVAFNAAWEEGKKMTIEQAVEYALEEVKSIS